MLIDIKTAYFLLGLLYVVMPLSTYIYLQSYRNNAIKLWCLGGLLNAAGLLMVSFRPSMLGHYPDYVIFTLTNTLIISGYTLRIQSLKMDMKLPMTPFQIIMIIVGIAIGYQLCVSLDRSLDSRVIFACLSTSVLLTVLARSGKQYQQYFSINNASAMFVMYGVLAALLMIKVTLILLGIQRSYVLDNSAVNSIMMIVGILAVIYSNIGYIALVLAKVEKDYKKTIIDNTEMLNLIEKRNAQIKDLMRAESISTVGAYGSTVVHEVLQPLTALSFGMENLETYLLKNNDANAKELLQAVKNPAEKAIGVVQNLRNFMVKRQIAVVPVDLHQILKEVLSLITARASGLGISIYIESSSGKYMVYSDPFQLQRVIFNIINNSLEVITHQTSTTSQKRILIKISKVQSKKWCFLK
jgi:signal transduction histidine kinase